MSQETGQQLALWVIRIAILFWFLFAWSRIQTAAAHSVDFRRASSTAPFSRFQKATWLLATILYVIHVCLAFVYFHESSHRLAVEHTTERTFEFTGVRWSGGIWLNHLFTLVCVVESLLLVARPGLLQKRGPVANGLIYGFLLFMMFNASVIFVSGPVRWICLTGFVALLIPAIRGRQQSGTSESGESA